MAPLLVVITVEIKDFIKRIEDHSETMNDIAKMELEIREYNKQANRDITLATKITLGHDTVIEEDK